MHPILRYPLTTSSSRSLLPVHLILGRRTLDISYHSDHVVCILSIILWSESNRDPLYNSAERGNGTETDKLPPLFGTLRPN